MTCLSSILMRLTAVNIYSSHKNLKPELFYNERHTLMTLAYIYPFIPSVCLSKEGIDLRWDSSQDGTLTQSEWHSFQLIKSLRNQWAVSDSAFEPVPGSHAQRKRERRWWCLFTIAPVKECGCNTRVFNHSSALSRRLQSEWRKKKEKFLLLICLLLS